MAFTCQGLSIKKKKILYYTMPFSSSDLGKFLKSVVLTSAVYSAVLLIKKVYENEDNVGRLYSRLRSCENDLEKFENNRELKE